MAHTKKEVEAMDRFRQMLDDVYELAGGLRDCTELAKEKDVFNQTRGALYELRGKARKLFYEWESGDIKG
jgi:hypothetical protein